MRLICVVSLFLSFHISGISYCPKMDAFVSQGQKDSACADCCDDPEVPTSPLKTDTCCINISVPAKQTLSLKADQQLPSLGHIDASVDTPVAIYHASLKVLPIRGNNASSTSRKILIPSWPRAPPASVIISLILN